MNRLGTRLPRALLLAWLRLPAPTACYTQDGGAVWAYRHKNKRGRG